MCVSVAACVCERCCVCVCFQCHQTKGEGSGRQPCGIPRWTRSSTRFLSSLAHQDDDGGSTAVIVSLVFNGFTGIYSNRTQVEVLESCFDFTVKVDSATALDPLLLLSLPLPPSVQSWQGCSGTRNAPIPASGIWYRTNTRVEYSKKLANNNCCVCM